MGLLANWSARAKMVLDGKGADADPAGAGLDVGEGSLDRLVPAEAGCMSWDTICKCEEFRGRWIALDRCRYDAGTGRATEGMVVDSDDDLVELCGRIRESHRRNCAILFCGEDGPSAPEKAH